MWEKGEFEVFGTVYRFWMKRYDNGSEWGIDGGRISKLEIKRGDEIICRYDRGWDIQPADENAQLAVESLIDANNY